MRRRTTIRRLLLASGLALAACARSPTAMNEAATHQAAGAARPGAQFPLRLGPDRRWLVDERGTPFLIQGDAAWSLIAQLDEADAEIYLEDRRRRGVNLVLVNLIEHQFADHAPRNAYGEAPFARAGDFSTPNPAYFAHADAVIRRAASKGIAVLLAPAYLGAGGGREGWYQEMVANGPARMASWGRYLGARYRAFDNILWLEGGDFTPPPAGLALVAAVVAGIKEQDARHLHVPHWGSPTSGTEVAADWIDVDTTYTVRLTYAKSLADHRRDQTDGRTRAHFLIESAYENEHGATPRSLRGQAWGALLTGACGQIFGNNPIWKFGPGWKSALDSPGMRSMTQLGALLAPRAWPTLVPDGGLLTAGQGTFGFADYAVCARGRDGRLAIAYLPELRDVTVDFSRLAGPALARWYDPSSGRFVAAAGASPPGRGARTLRPPGPNAEGSTDWVLVLEADGAEQAGGPGHDAQ